VIKWYLKMKLTVISIALILTSFAVKKKHVLTMLLTLELFSVLIVIIALLGGKEVFFSILMICIGACEGAVGLGAMARLSRTGGGIRL